MDLWKRGSVLAAICLSSLLLLAAAPKQDNKTAGKAASPKPDTKKEQVKGDPAKGKQVFEDNCAICHNADSNEEKVGPGLKGISKKGPDKLSDGTEHKDHGPAVLRKQIVEGGGTMPPVGAALSDQEVADLIAYLQTL